MKHCLSCLIYYLNAITREQIIICTKLFGGHGVGSWLLKRKQSNETLWSVYRVARASNAEEPQKLTNRQLFSKAIGKPSLYYNFNYSQIVSGKCL